MISWLFNVIMACLTRTAQKDWAAAMVARERTVAAAAVFIVSVVGVELELEAC